MSILQGRNLIVKVDGVAIAAAKSCEINIDVDTQEVANAQSGIWRKYMFGRGGWNITTNQLVTTIINPFRMVRTAVTIDVVLSGTLGRGFTGFVDNVELSDGDEPASPTTPAPVMYWDKTRKKFLLFNRGGNRPPYYAMYSSYYEFEGSERYSSPSNGDLFHCDGTVYSWYDGELRMEKLTGSALVTSWKGVFTIGNLAQGSFAFLGNGELSAAALPTTE